MKYEEVSWFSSRVEENLSIKVYGHYGKSIIVFPSLYKQSNEFYLEGVIDILSNDIEEGRIKLFCLDAIDFKSLTSDDPDFNKRTYYLNQYYEYIIYEVLPFIYDKNQGYTEPILMGCSAGATRAATIFLRRPDLFSGVLAISGHYDMSVFFNGYINDDIYNNSPNLFLKNMGKDHYYIELYNSRRMIFTVGKGAFEYKVLNSNYELKNIFNNLGINAWYDFYDENTIHDWSSWKYLIRKYLSYFI